MSHLLAFTSFVFVAGVTPGPANVAILAKSTAAGFRGGAPFVVGILFGFLLVLSVAAALYVAGIGLVGRWLIFLKVAGGVYLLYLAREIWKDGARLNEALLEDNGVRKGVPIHLLSIKAWLFVLLSYTTFAIGKTVPTISLYVLIFFLSAVVAHAGWMAAGALLNKHVDSRYLHIVNRVSAVALAVLVVAIFVV